MGAGLVFVDDTLIGPSFGLQLFRFCGLMSSSRLGEKVSDSIKSMHLTVAFGFFDLKKTRWNLIECNLY
ncbi:MAG: hypothetical protein DWH73_01240 [Planctomycetota bacterium]|nr:MAG: hypothetical protein DWH73_01240 [Planctomycetota bacterium]